MCGILLWLGLIICWGDIMGVEAATEPVKRYRVRILRTLPHDTKSFTQGLVYYQGMLYESTGLYGRSSLQRIEVHSGDVQHYLAVDDVFAEGLARWENRLIQLTWKQGIAFVYNLVDFSKIAQFNYATEGWGLTADQHSLIMSDGSDILYFRDPYSFDIIREVHVTLDVTPVRRLNELEYIDGLVYANIWGENVIAQIDPDTGQVRGIIDAASLRRMQPPLSGDSVLNGIAYNAEQKTIYLTGKNWPTLFEVTLVQDF